VAGLRTSRDEETERVSRLLSELPQFATDPNETLLVEHRLSRAWNRVKPQLDAGRHRSSILCDAVAQGDLDTLRALRAELPGWAAGREVYDSSPSSAAGMEAAQAEFRRQVRAEVDTALARVASGTEAEAAELRVRQAATLDLVDALLSGVGQEAAGVSVYGLADALVVQAAERELKAAELALE
jgi:hypothetical protein